jgi:hypothetical protein
MTKAINAKVGGVEKCGICQTEMTCGQTQGTPEYPAKNQWQVNGKAHYNYDFKTKTTTCNGQIIEDPKNTRIVQPGTMDKVYSQPKITDISPEVLRTETFIEFEKVYCEGFVKAKALVESLRIGIKDEPEVRFSIATLITKKYVDFYIARNLK